MKPTTELARAKIPGSDQELVLVEHDGDFRIEINHEVLMTSRARSSEEALALLTCDSLRTHPRPRVFVGGLGMGATLQALLPILGKRSRVRVLELVPEVVDWNRSYFRELTEGAVDDPRVEVEIGDAVTALWEEDTRYDAILLDIDNGALAMTASGNTDLYQREGILSCRDRLKPHGVLGLWSSQKEPEYARQLRKAGFRVETFGVKAHPNAKRPSHSVIVAQVR